ncbi:RNA polymerase sigma factor [Ancylobacter sp. 6x-1]|uniref:RNA polymerase sigma factor n=1 Tax=Ancylobacter crimeensis TaxID=2579147 RepID=A0ABT0DB33_9HYPH|nr:RNA polymerase sigma factor [Ancylobacter crimeensis]MCK0197172.1 RNA polymerase sigma factor [Ancylobacter crimeensis]
MHAPELGRFLRRRLGDPHAASDLVQDTFLRVVERPETRVQDLRAYLFAIARNLLLNHVKQEARRRTDAVPHEWMAEVAADVPTPEDEVHSRLELERLHRLIAALPPRTQQIFALNRIDGLSHADVARRLGLSESAVQKHLAQAVLHVTRALRGQGA